MSFNMAEAKALISVQTEGDDKITLLSRSVKDLSAEVKRLAGETSVGGNAAARMAADAQRAASGITATGKSGNLAGHHMQNLAFQFQDLGVQMAAAAGSSNPLKMVFMALLQQGSQISGVLSQAGVGLGGMVKELAATYPVLTSFAVGAAAAAAGIGLITAEINESSKVHVTWMDTALGAMDAVAAYLKGELTDAYKYWGITSKDAFETSVHYARSATNKIIGATLAVPAAIGVTLTTIPFAFRDAFTSAANMAIDALNGLVHSTGGAMNGLVDTFNGVFGTHIPRITIGNIERLKNPMAGAMSTLGTIGAHAFTAAYNYDYLGAGAAAVSGYAQERARQRLAEDGKKNGKHAGKAAGKSAQEQFLEEFTKSVGQSNERLRKWGADFSKSVFEGMKDRGANDLDGVRTDMAMQAAERVKPAIEDAEAHYNSFGGGMDRAFQGYAESIGSVGESAFQMWNKALKGTEDALVNFAMTGKLSIKDLANSIIADLVRIAIQQAIMKPLGAALGLPFFANGAAFSNGSVVASAKGNVFSGGNVQAFATGGVVSRPTLFPMAGGRTGLMGEAGEEAIMPLRRLPNGRLGVESAGGGSTGGVNVSVAVDASGSQVQGDGAAAAQLGQAIGQAVQAELVRQKRPGGLLAA